MAQHRVQVNHLAEEGGKKLLVRLSADRGGNRIKVLFDMLLNVLLAERAGIIFLFLGKPCQPFGSGKQRIGKTVDNHSTLRVNAVCFIPLNGGFVYADTLSKLRHGKV